MKLPSKIYVIFSQYSVNNLIENVFTDREAAYHEYGKLRKRDKSLVIKEYNLNGD